MARRGGATGAALQPLSLRVLGSVAIERGGERLELPPSKKTRALLGYLLVEGREQTREHLCSLFWDLPDDPRGALRWSLSRLRPLLDTPGRQRVVADREQVRIDPAGALVDLRAAEALRAKGFAQASVEELRETAALFRGELLEGLELGDAFRFQAWCTARREEARRLHAEVLRALVARLAGAPEEALHAARRLVELEPTDESAHRRVMELLGRLNRTREAIAQYDALREILRTTAAGNPSLETEQVRRGLGSAAPAPPSPRGKEPAHLPAQAALVGRAAECAQLEAAAGVILLVGEPGIGKTRLLEELAARSREPVLLGRCYEAEQARPYGCMIEALRASGLAARAGEVLRRDLGALLTELAPPLEGLDRARLFDAVAALLRENAPLRLLLDDVQWMDEASAALAHYLARTAPGVRLVLAARAGELADNAAALRLLRALRHEQSLVELRVGPLGAKAIADLLRGGGIAADPKEVHAQSAGNPLLALELGRALAEGHALSGGLWEALEQRIDALEEGAQSLLGWAAALGGAVQPALLARATGRPEAEIVESVALLERRGLLRFRTGGAIDFAHDLMREAALRRIPTARRRLLHAALARSLQDLPGLAGTVARQALLGGEDALAVRASVVAAQEAMRVFAGQEALAIAQQALPLLSALPRKERLRAHLELLEVCLHSDRREERLERVARELSRLVLEAEASGLSDVVADGLQALSVAQYFREDEQEALTGSLRGAEVARSEKDPLRRARALAQAGRCLAQLERDLEQAAKLLDEAAAAAQSARAVVLDIEVGRGFVCCFNGEDAAAREHLRAAADGAHEAGDHWRETEALFALCRLALERGEAAEALRAAEAVLPVAQRMPEGDEPAIARGLLALARMLDAQQRGESDSQADALFFSAADELRRNEARWRLAQLLLLRADLDFAAGRFDQASALAQEVRGLGGEFTVQMRHGRAHVLEAELALVRGDAACAREHLTSALTAPGSIGARLRARISAAAARAGFKPGGPHAEVRGGA
jgi:DNA-binding SARP family transcriptional activator